MNVAKTAVIVVHGIHPTPRFEIQDLYATQLLRRLNGDAGGLAWKLSILWPAIANPDAQPGDVHATALRICQKDDNADEPASSFFDIFEAYWSPIDKNQTTLQKVLAWLADAIFVPLNASAKLYSGTGKVLFDLVLVLSVLAASLVLFVAAAVVANAGYRVFARAAICATSGKPPDCSTTLPSFFDFILHPATTMQGFAWQALLCVAIIFAGAYALTQLAISTYHTCAEAYRRNRARKCGDSGLLQTRRMWRLWFQALLLIVAVFGLWIWPWFRPFVPDPSHRLMYSTLVAVLLVGLIRSALGMLNEFFVNTLGDVQIYTTHDENSGFYKLRKQIVETVEGIVLQVLRASAGPLTTQPVPDVAEMRQAFEEALPALYDRVIVAGHSLGSTIAMDALLNIHEMYSEGGLTKEQWLRLRALVTFGSALEKTKFFFDVKQPTVSASADHWRNDVYGKLFTRDFTLLSAGERTRDSGIFWANYWYFHDPVANEIQSYADAHGQAICENTLLKSKFSLLHPWIHGDYLWDATFWQKSTDPNRHGMLDILDPTMQRGS
jgi:hypothetical protein